MRSQKRVPRSAGVGWDLGRDDGDVPKRAYPVILEEE